MKILFKSRKDFKKAKFDWNPLFLCHVGATANALLIKCVAPTVRDSGHRYLRKEHKQTSSLLFCVTYYNDFKRESLNLVSVKCRYTGKSFSEARTICIKRKMLCNKIVLNVKTKQKQQFVYTTCSAGILSLQFSWTMEELLTNIYLYICTYLLYETTNSRILSAVLQNFFFKAF